MNTCLYRYLGISSSGMGSLSAWKSSKKMANTCREKWKPYWEVKVCAVGSEVQCSAVKGNIILWWYVLLFMGHLPRVCYQNEDRLFKTGSSGECLDARERK